MQMDTGASSRLGKGRISGLVARFESSAINDLFLGELAPLVFLAKQKSIGIGRHSPTCNRGL
jgi:hypothetical protein